MLVPFAVTAGFMSEFNQARIFDGLLLLSAEQLADHECVLKWLRESDRLNLRRLFHTLPPPRIDSLDGEYDAELLSQGGPILRVVTSGLFGMHGRWLGKAFRPVGEDVGEGYNYFHSRGSIVHRMPMDTSISTSSLDDQPSMKLSYRTRNRGLIRQLVGELRQVTPKILLGVGLFGPTIARRDVYRRKIPFILVGPCRQYAAQSQAA